MSEMNVEKFEVEVDRVYKAISNTVSTESVPVVYGALVHLLGVVMFNLHHAEPDELFDHTIEGLEIVFNAAVDSSGEPH